VAEVEQLRGGGLHQPGRAAVVTARALRRLLSTPERLMVLLSQRKRILERPG